MTDQKPVSRLAGETALSRRSMLLGSGGLLLTPALLAACGGDDDTDSAGAPSAAGQSSSASPGQTGGRLVLGVPVPFGSFDPYDHLTTNFVALHTFYDYLITYTEDLEPVPALAESWEISADSTEVTINLREAAFHSGKAVTAADLVTGIKRAKDPELGSNQRGPASIIDTAEAVDERTLHLVLTGPTPEGLVTDWMNWFPIVEADKNDPESLTSEPAGSGPFRFDAYSPGVSLTMSKNTDYWDDGKPYLDAAEVRFFDDQDSLVAALQSGDVDAASYLASRYVEQLEGSGFTTMEGASDALVDLFYMNPSLPPFDNADLRLALARAINRDRIIEQVRFGVGDAVYNAFGPHSPAFDASYLDDYGYDLEAARAMLDAAGGGRSAVAAVQPAPGVRESMQIIQADFAEIGFDLQIEPMEQTTFVTELRAGNLQTCISATSNTYRSPANVAAGSLLVTADNPLWKSTGVPSDYVDAVNSAKTALTPEAQQEAYHALNEAFAKNAWAIGTATRPSLHAFASNVSGYARDGGDHLILTETTIS